MRREKIGRLLAKVRRPGKLPASQYLPEGDFPVIDQGASVIAGYHNDPELVFRGPLPITIFGDHTRAVKLSREPFICGADGTQLLYPNDESVDPVYFYYAVQNVDLSNYFYARHLKFLRDHEISIPSLDVQRRIVDFIEPIDDLIENNRRRIALLEQSARLLYREWFVYLRFPGHQHVKVVDGVPEGWAIFAVSEVADLYRGISYSSDQLVEEGGKPFVNLKCMNRFGGFRVSGVKRFLGEHKSQHVVKAGDIVVAVTDMTRDAMIVAQAAIVPKIVGDDAVFSMDMVKLVPKTAFASHWFHALLRFSSFSFEVREKATGATVLHLRPKHIEEWRTPIPPPALRDEYAEYVSPMYALMDELELQNEKLRQARDLLLPRLMSGELAV